VGSGVGVRLSSVGSGVLVAVALGGTGVDVGSEVGCTGVDVAAGWVAPTVGVAVGTTCAEVAVTSAIGTLGWGEASSTGSVVPTGMPVPPQVLRPMARKVRTDRFHRRFLFKLHLTIQLPAATKKP
jgi:hypothetical protein